MSKKNIFSLILALALMGVLVFCITSTLIAGGGGGSPLCTEGCDKIEGIVTYDTLSDCYHASGDCAVIKYRDPITCEWVYDSTELVWDGENYSYTHYWPEYVCEVWLSDEPGDCSGCGSSIHHIDRCDCDDGETYEQDLYMRWRGQCD